MAAPVDVYSVEDGEGAAWRPLVHVQAVAFDDVRHLYVLDADSRVRVFDPDGRFVREVGRPGAGPGEIGRALGMAVAGDGTIAVVDPSSGYHVFGPEGEYVRTVRPAIPAFSSQVVVVGSELILAGGTLTSMLAGREGRGMPVIRQELRAEEPATVIYEADVPTIETTKGSEGTTSNYRFRLPALYSASLKLAAASRRRIALVSGTGWKVELLTPDGLAVATLTRPISGRKSTAADREAVEARMREARGGREASTTFGGGSVSPPRSRVVIADTIPAIRAIRGDGYGLLLVARETDPVAGELPPFDVIRPDGSYAGTVRDQPLPDALGPDGLAAYVVADELGRERIVVRRLPSEWTGR